MAGFLKRRLMMRWDGGRWDFNNYYRIAAGDEKNVLMVAGPPPLPLSEDGKRREIDFNAI